MTGCNCNIEVKASPVTTCASCGYLCGGDEEATVSCPAMGVSGEMHPVCGFALAAHRLAAAERVVEAARAFSDEMGESHWGYSGKSPCSEKHNQLEHALIAYDAATAAREGR